MNNVTNEWNRIQEDLLKKWSSMSKTYSTMHSLSAEFYNKWDKRLGIPVVLLGAITASSIFTTTSENNSYHLWEYINGGLVLLMTGISGITKFLGLNEKLSKHNSASFKYTQISMNIDTMLSFPRNNRDKNPREFINQTKLAILEVREHSPDLPTKVISEYIKKLDKTIVNTDTKVNRHRLKTDKNKSISVEESLSCDTKEEIYEKDKHIINIDFTNDKNLSSSNNKKKYTIKKNNNNNRRDSEMCKDFIQDKKTTTLVNLTTKLDRDEHTDSESSNSELEEK